MKERDIKDSWGSRENILLIDFNNIDLCIGFTMYFLAVSTTTFLFSYFCDKKIKKKLLSLKNLNGLKYLYKRMCAFHV